MCEAEVKLASFEQRIAELKDVGVKHLTLAAPLLNRKEATVIAATSKLFARYRALQVPVFRIKTDLETWSIVLLLETSLPEKTAEDCSASSPAVCWIAYPRLAYST